MMKANHNDSSIDHEAQEEEFKNSQHTLLNSHNFSFNFGNGIINSDHDSNQSPNKRNRSSINSKFMKHLNKREKKM